MGIKLNYIKKYLELKPLAEITLTSGSDEEYQTEVFSCLSYIHDFKNIQKDLFIEIEENSFDGKYLDYYNKYKILLEDSITDVPTVSNESIKKHFEYFNLIYENFDSLYVLLVNPVAISHLGLEWAENNDKEGPKGPQEWVQIQNDIFHFTKRKSAEMLKKHLLINGDNDNNAKKIKQKINPYTRIFKTDGAFILFTAYQEHVKNNLADYSFIYRMMIKDELMYEIKENEFKTWLNHEFEIALDQVKQLQNCSSHNKNSIYSILKDNHIYKI